MHIVGAGYGGDWLTLDLKVPGILCDDLPRQHCPPRQGLIGEKGLLLRRPRGRVDGHRSAHLQVAVNEVREKAIRNQRQAFADVVWDSKILKPLDNFLKVLIGHYWQEEPAKIQRIVLRRI
jgi:hypothetical protein